jgi:phosphatidylglycerol:prolipoprotein diacylglycerol transferase
MHPVLIDFGWLWSLFGADPANAFKLHTYGLMIALGFLVGMQLGAREARRIDVSKEGGFDQFILDLTFWILVVSIVGARLLFIIVEWNDVYARDPLKIFKVWEGGFVFYGGFIAAVLFSVVYCRRNGRSFLVVADTLIPSVALGHFFGRLGCLAAGCCWGVPVSEDFLFAVQFPDGALAHTSMANAGIIEPTKAHTPHVHPVQLYESFGELAIFFTLLFVRSIKRFHGQTLLAYLFLYPILRTSLEFLRGDKARGEYALFGGVTVSTSQIISVLVAVAAVTLLASLVQKKRRRASPSAMAAA